MSTGNQNISSYEMFTVDMHSFIFIIIYIG